MTNKDAENRAHSNTEGPGSESIRWSPNLTSISEDRSEKPGSPADGGPCRHGCNTAEHCQTVPERDAALIAVAEAELGPAPDLRRGHYVIDPGRLRADLGDNFDPDESDATVSGEDATRLHRLRRLAADPDLLYKPHLVASEDTIGRLERVKDLAPNAGSAVDILIGAARISATTRTPIEVPPIMLVGPPGCGKSRAVREVGMAFGTQIMSLLGSTMADGGAILGTGVGWRGAAPGRLADDLLKSSKSAVLGFVDEVEKMRIWDRRSHASDILLGLLDPDMAAAHQDNYYQVPMRADRMIWLFAANSLAELSDPFLDRCVVCEMQPPDRDERRAIVQRIHAEIVARLELDPEPRLDDREVDLLADISLRRVGPAVQLALGRAMTAGRGRISADDLAWARAVVERGRTPERRRIGF